MALPDICQRSPVCGVATARANRGGHGRALDEFRLFQRIINAGGTERPAIVVVGIDGNCSTSAKKRSEIEETVLADFSPRVIPACADPHIERWYLCDPDSFQLSVGVRPTVPDRKCERDFYKRLLASSVREAGHPYTLGGIEFADELARTMDLFRAGKNDRSLKTFVEDLRGCLQQFVNTRSPDGRTKERRDDG